MARFVEVSVSYPIPHNWKWDSIGNYAKIKSGYPFDSEKFSDDPTGRQPLIRIRDILRESTNTFTDECCPEEYIIHAGDILIGMDGDFNVGKWNSDDALLNQRVCYIQSNSNCLLNDYLYYYLPGILKIINNATPSVTVKHLSANTLRKTQIPLPPLAEQQRIVERIESLFAKLDEAKEKAQAVVDSFETRKAAILHKAFTGELTAKWREEHGVGMESWEQCSISDVCTVNPKKADTKDLPDELEVSFFPMPALSEIYGEITDPQTRLLKEVRSGFTNFSEGDVVFAKITPCMENGKSAVVGKLVNDIGYGTTEFFVLRCSDRLYNRFLYHLVRDKLFRDKAKAVMAGAVGQQRVPKRYLETYKLNLPKFNEQLEIVRILDGSFAKEQQAKEAAEAVLEQIDLMKKSILTRAFRGELGTNDPSEESAVELLKQIF